MTLKLYGHLHSNFFSTNANVNTLTCKVAFKVQTRRKWDL